MADIIEVNGMKFEKARLLPNFQEVYASDPCQECMESIKEKQKSSLTVYLSNYGHLIWNGYRYFVIGIGYEQYY